MERDHALRIVAYLNAAFPHDALDKGATAVMADELSLLIDGNVAMEAARISVRGGDRMPTIREFRQTYKAVAERQAHALADERGLEQGSTTKIPEWVHVWWWARNGRVPPEDRPFPQQRPAVGDAPDMLANSDYQALKVEWQAAGSPKLGSARQLARMAEGAS